ncbi:translation initiation factor IF-2-like [Schistocerca serialis cubense]|uniref:translation initiation factor IF-2-like n=1 Tax=Schistocerca serialis cubense TaxID=2023355 RepID=UPI00214DF6AC|nr:translation initiation factor IF-2-like [Schistocerca serialis cubense]
MGGTAVHFIWFPAGSGLGSERRNLRRQLAHTAAANSRGSRWALGPRAGGGAGRTAPLDALSGRRAAPRRFLDVSAGSDRDRRTAEAAYRPTAALTSRPEAPGQPRVLPPATCQQQCVHSCRAANPPPPASHGASAASPPLVSGSADAPRPSTSYPPRSSPTSPFHGCQPVSRGGARLGRAGLSAAGARSPSCPAAFACPHPSFSSLTLPAFTTTLPDTPNPAVTCKVGSFAAPLHLLFLLLCNASQNFSIWSQVS